jgi:type IV pilus assembly protein PilB
VPTIDLDAYEVADEILLLLSKDTCAKHVVLPISRAGTSLIVAMADPNDAAAREDLTHISGLNIEPVIATRAAIRSAIGRYYPT